MQDQWWDNQFSISWSEPCSNLLLTLGVNIKLTLMLREQKSHLKLSSVICGNTLKARPQQVEQGNNMARTEGLCSQASISLPMATTDDFGQHKLRDSISGRWCHRITAVGKDKSRSGLKPSGALKCNSESGRRCPVQLSGPRRQMSKMTPLSAGMSTI